MRAKHESGLSQRQLQILQMVANGETGVSVARKLFRSIKTIDTHLVAVRETLGVRTTTHAVAHAIRMRWID